MPCELKEDCCGQGPGCPLWQRGASEPAPEPETWQDQLKGWFLVAVAAALVWAAHHYGIT